MVACESMYLSLFNSFELIGQFVNFGSSPLFIHFIGAISISLFISLKRFRPLRTYSTKMSTQQDDQLGQNNNAVADQFSYISPHFMQNTFQQPYQHPYWPQSWNSGILALGLGPGQTPNFGFGMNASNQSLNDTGFVEGSMSSSMVIKQQYKQLMGILRRFGLS